MKRNFSRAKKALAIVLTVTMLIMAISSAIMVNASGTMDWSKWENVVPSENDSTVTLGSNTWMTYKEPIADGTYVLNTVYEIESAKIAGAKVYRLAIKLEKTAAGFNYATLRVSTDGVLQTPVFYNQDDETLSDEYTVTQSGSIDSTGAFKVSISYDVDAKKITIEFTDNVGGSAVATITANSAETDFVNNTIVPEISFPNEVVLSKATVTTGVPTVDIWSNIDSEGNATVGEPITYYLNGVEDAQYVKSVEWTLKSHNLKSNNSSIMTVYYDGIDSGNYITYRFTDAGKLYMKKVGSDSITCASTAVSSSRFGTFGDAEISKLGAAFKIKLEYLTSNTATLTFTNGSNPENITKFDISTNRVIDFLSDTHQFAIKVGNTAVFDMDNQPVVEMVGLPFDEVYGDLLNGTVTPANAETVLEMYADYQELDDAEAIEYTEAVESAVTNAGLRPIQSGSTLSVDAQNTHVAFYMSAPEGLRTYTEIGAIVSTYNYMVENNISILDKSAIGDGVLNAKKTYANSDARADSALFSMKGMFEATENWGNWFVIRFYVVYEVDGREITIYSAGSNQFIENNPDDATEVSSDGVLIRSINGLIKNISATLDTKVANNGAVEGVDYVDAEGNTQETYTGIALDAAIESNGGTSKCGTALNTLYFLMAYKNAL